MHLNINTPPDPDEARERLIGKMRQYRGEYGIYAAEMLETARLLLEQSEQHPRQAETVAYCVRQAVEEIFGDTRDYKEPTEKVVGRAVEAKKNIQTAGTVGEENLQSLYEAVDELRDRFCKPKPEARLKKIFRQSSGIDPESGDHSIVQAYRRIIDDSNDFLHRVSKTRADMVEVRALYKEAIDVLTVIFLPSVRLRKIKQLAESPTPQKGDVDRLMTIMVNAYGFGYFARMMVSSDWFDMMGPNMLKSSSGNSPWLLRSLVRYLRVEHADAFIRMVEKNFALWVVEDAGFAELGFVGKELGGAGLALLVKALQKSESVRHRCNNELALYSEEVKPPNLGREKILRVLGSIRSLEKFALQAYEEAEPTNPALPKLANHLMGIKINLDERDKTNTIPIRLVEGINSSSAMERINILTYNIRNRLRMKNRPYVSRLDSIADMDQDSYFGMNAMLGSLCVALTRAKDLNLPTAQLVETLSVLPDGVKHRFVAWLYSRADDVARAELVDFVVEGYGTRYPTGDDEALLAKLVHDGCIDGDAAGRIDGLLRDAPESKKMVGRPQEWGFDKEDWRRILWAHMLHNMIKLPDEWDECMDILNPFIDEERRVASERVSGTSEAQKIPTGRKISDNDDPREMAAKIAIQRPNTGGLLEQIDVPSPLADLENTVKHNASKWIENPIEIIQSLRYPEYVAGYFRGLAGAKDALPTHADQIVSAVKFAKNFQWEGGALDLPIFYHYGERVSVDMAGIMLIEEMVKSGASLGEDSLADVWSIVSGAVALPDPKTDEQPDCSIEYLYTVDDQPHVRAVYTLFEVIRYAKQNNAEVPKTVLARLTKAIRLTGRYGVDYHACIGREAFFVHRVDPDWFAQNEQYLFGSATSTELRKVALDRYLMSGRPDEFILEKYQESVLYAVKHDTHDALYHLLYGLLCGTHGYDPKYIAKELMKIGPEYVSKTGWYVHQLLSEGAGADTVQRGIAFWDCVLKHSPKPEPEALVGFGWWADVPGIDQEQWEELMMRTCELAEKLEWAWKVAERISASQPITDTGWQILEQLFSLDLQYDEVEVGEYAIDALRKTTGNVDAPTSRSYLREVLLEHGFHKAEEF